MDYVKERYGQSAIKIPRSIISNFKYGFISLPTGDMSATLTMTNTTDHMRIVEITMSAAAVYYTGVSGEEIIEKKETVEIRANGSK